MIIEDPSLKKFLHPLDGDKRRQRRYHRKASEWWSLQQTTSAKRLAACHKRDARNG